jgi:hypothetical protein
MDEQILSFLIEDPYVMRFSLDDPFVIGLAIVFGIGALGTIGALALAEFLRRRKR